ncbi:hypothetical protein DAPPUDRAFT_239015 [Daphnia pulex]|uniref:Uncharacterized protein n=1 Tax=Daphnia pulex TaxID=6669 RepID=E9G800_DAPPU|nr:hypothetical protein DAPPUDRAFT_239015 [Daphnia pulex]|eukprot:EFX84573.1 hypothetical protein DAPPUDRAFT_239015 [Daphnia pulex]
MARQTVNHAANDTGAGISTGGLLAHHITGSLASGIACLRANQSVATPKALIRGSGISNQVG